MTIVSLAVVVRATHRSDNSRISGLWTWIALLVVHRGHDTKNVVCVRQIMRIAKTKFPGFSVMRKQPSILYSLPG